MVVVLTLFYFQLTVWHSHAVGILLFVFYLWFVGDYWRCILHRIFGLRHQDWMTIVLSFFVVFTLLGLFTSILVVWYKITPALLWGVYLFLTIFSYTLFLLINKNRNRDFFIREKSNFDFAIFPKNSIFLAIFFVLILITTFLLFKTSSTEALFSPWQSIDRLVLPLTFLSIFILGVLVCSKYKVKTLLFLIIVQSLAMHLYLPLSHRLPWGGDVWRHVAVESKLLDGQSVLPVLFGSEASWREVASVDLPEALVIPNKYLYGHLWGSTVLLSSTLDIDLLTLNKWLMVFLWSLVLPIVLLRIGRLLFGSWRAALFLAFLSLIPFTFQALGSLTLPVSFGLLLFLFTLMLWLQYLHKNDRRQRNLTIFFSTLMIFGYTLFFILLWSFIIISLIFKNINLKDNKFFEKVIFIFSIIVAVCVWPVIETVSGSSHFPQSWNMFDQLKQMLGQFSGWYYANAIRSHDILSGNILFNHTPDYAFVSNLFTDWRWPVMVVTFGIFVLTIFGFWQSVKNKNLIWLVFNIFSTSVVGGYLLSWFVLEGDRSFVRRLDPVFALLILIYVIVGFCGINFGKMKKRYRALVFFSMIVMFAWLGTVSFASGPDMRVVSIDEYKVANYIYDLSKKDGFDLGCVRVLSDTWSLLPLESISKGEIVGGNFPIDYQFGQEQRISLYDSLIKDSIVAGQTSPLFEKLDKKGVCAFFFARPQETMSEEEVEQFTLLSGGVLERYSGFFIWYYQLPLNIYTK